MRFAPLALLLATTTHATKSSLGPAAIAPQRDAVIDALRHHINEDVAHVHLRDLLEDEDRCLKCTAEACGIYMDYARQKATVHTIDLLVNVARACNMEEKRDAMFRGEVMNPTEQRSVRHVSLRATRGDPYAIEEAQDTLDRVLDFARAVRCKRVKGASGEALTDVVAIGIGGSSLGPACVHEALKCCMILEEARLPFMMKRLTSTRARRRARGAPTRPSSTCTSAPSTVAVARSTRRFLRDSVAPASRRAARARARMGRPAEAPPPTLSCELAGCPKL